jgi:tripartite-type tricarboxylate transporter receptor subunit TctC
MLAWLSAQGLSARILEWEQVMNRREVLKTGIASIAAVSAGGSVTGEAQVAEWPTRQVRIVVPFAAGSATDLVPRTIFEQVGKQVGQTFVVENRPGGGTTIGTAAVARAEPDGYTMLVHSNGLVTVPAIQASVPYDPVKDFAALTPLGNVPMVLVVGPDQGIKTVKDLVQKAKAGSMTYGAAGIGTPPHLTMERFRLSAGFAGQLVPFKGAPEALVEVMTGRVDMYFSPITPALSLIREGKVLAIAVSSARRAAALPDVPTTIEAGVPDSDFDFWVGAVVPKKTPRAIVTRMHAEIVKALNEPAIKEKLARIGVEQMIMEPAAFDARIEKEVDIARTLAKAANIQPQ